jgi:hypothetical protein
VNRSSPTATIAARILEPPGSRRAASLGRAGFNRMETETLEEFYQVWNWNAWKQ